MNGSRWQRIDEIFRAVVDLPASEQAARLETLCGEDTELHQALRSLIASDQEAGNFLEDALLGGIELVEEQVGTEQRIGPYRLLERIGSGGMGAVFRAARADSEYDQQVAVKLIHTGMGTPLTVERFRRERQILASLEHPNIARLLDGGTTHTGLPYLVMEHIEGDPIDDYCDRLALPIEERLRLFVTVCDAVDFAHQHLVIHRDLKPSNILVTEGGAVKLLDFGIAKLLDEDGEPTGEPTLTLDRAMTPSYASPEQVRGELVSTSSDVYSLGVVLYELLTGRKPLDLSSVTRSEAERRILEDPPTPPSQVALSGRAGTQTEPAAEHAEVEELASRRGLRPEALSRQLRGDLDTLVLTALRKERSHRYPSAEKMANELRRFLEGRPIQARRPTLAYRWGKFLRRHRVAAAVATGFLVMASVFAVMLWRSTAAAREEREIQSTIARVILDIAESSKNGAPDLAPHLARLELEFGERPKAKSDLLEQLARYFSNIGHTDSARMLAEKAILTARRANGQQAGPLADRLNKLGEFFRRHLGDVARSEELQREAYALHMSQPRRNATRTADLLNDLALSVEADRPDEALGLYEQALEIYRSQPGEQRQWIATALSNYGILLDDLGRSEEAETALREALELDQQLFSEPHPSLARDLDHLGTVLTNRGSGREAIEYHQRALAMSRQLLPPDDRELLRMVNNLAYLLTSLGENTQAEPLLREVVETWHDKFGPDHPNYPLYLKNLADALQRAGKENYDEAEGLLTTALEIQRRNGDLDSLAPNLVTLGNLRLYTGELASAAELYREAVSRTRGQPTGQGNHASALLGLGLALRADGKTTEAIGVLADAAERFAEVFGPEHPSTGIALTEQARALSQAGFASRAEAVLERAKRLYETTDPPGALGGYTLAALAEHQLRQGQTEPALEAALAGRQQIGDDAYPKYRAIADSLLGAALTAAGRFEEAEERVTASHDWLLARYGSAYPETADARARCRALYRQWSRPRPAEACGES